MNKIDIIELIKTIIKLRLTNSSHRIVIGIIFIFSSIWAIGNFNLEECNQTLLFLPLLLGLFLILSNLLSADKSKKNFRTKVIEIVFVLSFLASVTFLLFNYFNCSGFRQFLITSRTNSLVQLKDCKPKSGTKLVSKIIIKEVEKEPQHIYNTTLNYQINIYESTDSLSESPFYLAELNYSLTKKDNNFFTNFIVGAKKISLKFNENVEFKSLNEIVKNIKVFVNNLPIQMDSFKLSGENQLIQQVNFEGSFYDWTSKINNLKTKQKNNPANDLELINSLRKRVILLEGEIKKSRKGNLVENGDLSQNSQTEQSVIQIDSCKEVSIPINTWTQS